MKGCSKVRRPLAGLSLAEKVVCLLLLLLLVLTMPLRSVGWPFGFDIVGEVVQLRVAELRRIELFAFQSWRLGALR